MRYPTLSKLASAAAVVLALGLAAPSHAVLPNVSSNPDTDSFRTGGCTGCFLTQMTGVVVQFQQIDRAFRLCDTGGSIQDDGSGCDGAGHGRIADFVVIQGILKNSTTDPNGLGVPNGPSLGEVTYRVSANGSGFGVGCARSSPAPVGMGYLAPEGFDGVPNTADDAGGTGSFGVPGPGVNAGTSSMSAAPLTNCQGKTGIQNYDTIGSTTMSFLTGTNTELCVVNYDLNNDGNINNDTAGAAPPGAITTVGGVSGNETTNLVLSCSTGFSDLPTGDFLPPKTPYNQPDVFGAQIFKLGVSRDVHAAGNTDAKIHLNKPQMENLFGQPTSNSICSLNTIGAASSATNNVTACIRPAGSGTRETMRNTWIANTEGSKVQSEDTAGGTNGTTATCIQPKEAGGSQIATKRIKLANGNADVINCLNSFPGSFTYTDADRFDPAFYAAVVEGVDPDSAETVATPGVNDLKTMVKCGHYRWWGPLAGGVGPKNPGSAFVTAHRSALKNPTVYANKLAYLPLNGVAFSKQATDGAYTITFIPTSCPAAPPAPLSISASPTTTP
jgi:hypothetical protein